MLEVKDAPDDDELEEHEADELDPETELLDDEAKPLDDDADVFAYA